VHRASVVSASDFLAAGLAERPIICAIGISFLGAMRFGRQAKQLRKSAP
jgi:hypothetical protein